MIFILFICSSLRAFAVPDSLNQVNYDKQLTFETGGSGGLYSINYERPWGLTARLQYRVGICIFKFDNRWQLTNPQMIQKTLGQKKNKLIVGAGIAPTLAYYDYGSFGFYARGILALGWHHQDHAKRFFFRLCYTPFFSFIYDWQYDHWGGITFGYKLVP